MGGVKYKLFQGRIEDSIYSQRWEKGGNNMANESRAIEYQESTVSEGGMPRVFDEPEGMGRPTEDPAG